MNARLFVSNQGAETSVAWPKGLLTIPEGAPIEHHQNPSGKSMWRTITHATVKQHVFFSPPTMDDIKQGGVTGDCYLLSALLAILALPQGQAIIMGMIMDRGSDVVVRLFDAYHTPHYICIEKSVPAQSGVLSCGALWVKLIEKAYVAFHGGNYSILEKGMPETAMNTIGAASNAYFLEDYCSLPYQNRKRLSDLKQYVDGNGIYLFHELMRAGPNTPRHIQNRMLQHIFNNDHRHFSLWMQCIHDKASYWNAFITKHHPIYKQDVESFIKRHLTNQTAQESIALVNDWITNEKILPGLPLSGEYSKEELALFTSIKKRLRHHCPITVSTSSSPKKGLMPLHTYAVISCEHNVKTGRKYVYVKNPFGENRSTFMNLFSMGGRTSDDVVVKHNDEKWAITVRATASSVSRMELSDFCSAFAFIDAFSPVSIQAIDERVNTPSSHTSVILD